jgi:plasmid stabilization system protein ParE
MPNRPKLNWSPGAVQDLSRLRAFIEPHNPDAASAAAHRLLTAADRLIANPLLGHPIEGVPGFRRIFIPFGKNGYTLSYRLDENNIVVLRVWHGREDRTSHE